MTEKINDKFIYIYIYIYIHIYIYIYIEGQSILAVSYGIIVIPSVPVYKQRGLNSDILSNLAFTFS
jgi:hypothetical protein